MLAVDDAQTVRLYKAKFEADPNLLPVTTPLVGGRVIEPNATIEGTGKIELPLKRVAADGTALELTPKQVEFCIGYSILADVRNTVVNESDYPQTENLESQKYICGTLTQP